MRVVVQRVSQASVTVGGTVRGEIGPGFVVLAGFSCSDSGEVIDRMAGKIAGLRLFEDDAGKMNRGLREIGGAILCISQFTLLGDVRRGRRPSFELAAPAEVAGPLYAAFCAAIERHGVRCAQGVFGAHMELRLLNDGPVTLVLDSEELDRPRRT